MTLESRLKKLERSTHVAGVEGIRAPAGLPQKIWLRTLELLADLPPEDSGRWTVEEFAAWYRERAPIATLHLPDVILDCVGRALIEAETGTLPPPVKEQARLKRADLGNWPEGKLIRLLRQLDARVMQNDRYLWPYSSFLLAELADDAAGHASYLARELRRGAITRPSRQVFCRSRGPTWREP